VPRAARGVPRSFGRPVEDEPSQEEFQVLGGQLIVQMDLLPSEESLDALYRLVRSTVAQAIRDGYAEAVGEPLPDDPDGVEGSPG